MTGDCEARTLLVVDDEEANRDVLSRRLERRGYSVRTAADGEEALRIIARGAIDLVLLDNMMPGVSGLEVLRTVRAQYSPAELPVIMVTAQAESRNVVLALEAGANDYITKPVDFAVALARLQNQLCHAAAGKALRTAQERYALAAEAAQDGLWDWDLAAGSVFYSSRWKQILGYEEDEIGDSPAEWLDRVHPVDAAQVRAALAAPRQPAAPRWECEHRLRRKDGSFIWVKVRGLAVFDSGDQPARIAGCMTDLTGSKLADPLTGLPNRLFLIEQLDSLLAHLRDAPAGQVALLLLGLDGFKVINDSLGHAGGDRVLAEFASTLESVLGSCGEGVAARLGGDEFAVLLEAVSGVEHPKRIAAAIQRAFDAPLSVEARPVFVSLSMGIVMAGKEYSAAEDLLRDADTAMHHAKTRGKRRYEVFDSRMRVRALARMELDSDLRAALAKGELTLFYQPKLSLAQRRIVGFEALLRWRRPGRGLVPPAEFIPYAEESGLIVPIGLWALREACTQAAKWQARYRSEPALSMGVNVSAAQISDRDLPEQIERILAETGIATGSLVVEITESMLLQDPDRVIEALSKLKQMGVRVDLDDFGTGYSSLQYLHRFPVDALKIDRSFVARLGQDGETAKIVRSIVSLAHSLGLDVIAEGIETDGQAATLDALGCGFAQGFHFSRPLPPREAESLLEARAHDEAADR